MTEKITREEIEALLKLAVAATPGPWKQHLVDDTTVICSQREICCTFAKGGLSDDLDFNSDTEQFEVDAAFIAAANPVVLKALCTLALQALAMQPRPIEEAPKDGTRFLAFQKTSEGWEHYDCWWHHGPKDEQYWMDASDSEPEPSHFIPLTSLPEPRR